MTTASDSGYADDEGRCPHHPFVQLRCRSQRTGDWRTLLETCPLCAADDSVCSGATGASASVAGGTVPAVVPASVRGRERTQSPVTRPSSSRGRSASRVLFPSAGKTMVRRGSVSVPPNLKKAAPKVLKAPKYKESKMAMQRQLDESEKQKVTFMSEDLSLNESSFWNSMGFEDGGNPEEDDASVLSGDPDDRDGNSAGTNRGDDREEKEEELLRMLSVEHEEEQRRTDQQVGGKMEKKLRNSIQLQQTRLQMPLPEEYEAEERSVGSARGSHSGGSRQHDRKVGRGGMARMPLPEDFEKQERRGGRPPRQGSGSSQDSFRDDGRSLGSLSSKASGRSRSSSRQPASGVPSRRGHSLRPSNTAPVPSRRSHSLRPGGVRVGPDPEELPCCPSKRSPSQEPSRRSAPPLPAPPRRPPPVHHGMSLQSVQGLPLEATPSGRPLRPPPPPAQPNHTGMIIAPRFEEEMSVISFMGGTNSVVTDLSDSSRYRHDHEDLEEDLQEDKEDEDEEGEENDPAAALINTADYDSKGRCVHHPHIRLRKKKMFGGWKTLMSACPDCCMNELLRIRTVDNKTKKMAKKKLDRAAKNRQKAAPPTSGSARSVLSAPPGVYGSGAALPGSLGSQRRSPRSASVPPQQIVHPSRSPSQESFRSAHASPRLQSKRSPSQDSYRSPPVPRRSPLQDSSQNGGTASGVNGQRPRPVPPAKALQTTPSDGSTSTASLTESEHLSGSDRSGTVPGDPHSSEKMIPLQALEERVSLSLHRNPPAPPLAPEKKTRSRSSSRGRSNKSGDRPGSPQDAPLQESPQLCTIHVREMQWTDPKGNSGRYTGQVDTQFVPCGHGSMVSDVSNKTRKGQWKKGKYIRSGSAGKPGNEGGMPSARRSRSKSRTVEGGGQSKSQGRSASRSGARQRSVSRHPQPVVAVFD